MPGVWMLSAHGVIRPHYDDQLTQRGARQFGATDWEMLMAMRQAGGGVLQFRLMTSLEPLILGGSGYPLLLQTGGTYQHSPIHDRQHPHEALMELAMEYEHSISSRIGWSTYLAATGEPALGPVTFMHRPSAENDPFAPLGHHWQDATHESFGVATVGIYSHTVKLEGSVFNPREADEHHLIVDYQGARLDSYSGRLSWMATPHVVIATWWGYLNSNERLDPTTHTHRYGASVLTDMRGVAGGRWSTSFVWGMNLHHYGPNSEAQTDGAPGTSPHQHSSSLLVESNLELGSRTAVFARVEGVRKNGEELGFQGGDPNPLSDIRSYVAGFTQQVATVGKLELGFGARASIDFVSEDLVSTYTTHTPKGFAVFMQVHPRRAPRSM